MRNVTYLLAEAAHGWQDRPLPEEVSLAARKAILDWFATTLPGTKQPPALLLSKAFANNPCRGNSVSYVDGARRSPRYAALVNGTASHTVEFDDIFKDGGYHPGSPTIAAALAVAQEIEADAEALHRAIVGGYELGCRVSLAIQPSHYRYWHITSTVGTLGAATAATMLLGGSASVIANAVALASSFAGGHQANLQGSGMAKSLHAGHAAEAGVLAGYAACQGVSASLESLDSNYGFAAATSDSTGNWQKALEGVGEWTAITRMTTKTHGCCGHIFPAIDGLTSLITMTVLSIEHIRRIHIEGYAATEQMCDRPDPSTPQEARFSLQYCLAAFLITGKLRLEAFETPSLMRVDIRELMRRITVSEDKDISKHYPERRMARVIVETMEGDTLTHLQEFRKGDPEDPLSLDELIEKYDELSGSAITPSVRQSLKKTIFETNDLPDLLENPK